MMLSAVQLLTCLPSLAYPLGPLRDAALPACSWQGWLTSRSFLVSTMSAGIAQLVFGAFLIHICRPESPAFKFCQCCTNYFNWSYLIYLLLLLVLSSDLWATSCRSFVYF